MKTAGNGWEYISPYAQIIRKICEKQEREMGKTNDELKFTDKCKFVYLITSLL